MSKPAPSTKQNFLQTALLFLTIFLGMRLLMPNNTQPPDLRTVDQLHAQLLQQDLTLKDQSIIATRTAYERKLDEDKSLSKADRDAKKVEAAVIVADVQLKAGIRWNDTSRIRAAYGTILPILKNDSTRPIWDQTIQVADATHDPRFGWNSWTPHSLYDHVIDTLSAKNKTDLIWGFIPGGYQLMDFLVKATGAIPSFSYAFAAFLLAFLVRAAVFPLAQKQLMAARQVSQLAPLMADIKAQFKDNPTEQQRRTMELYQEYGINPFQGCAPAFIQMPLFFTVYQCMLLYQFQFTKGTFLWVNPATSRASGGFFASNLGQLDAVLIVIYGVTMITTTLLTPVTDFSQKKQQRLIGLGFAVFATVSMFTGVFPVAGGFVLYWIFTNILATAQLLRAYRMPLPPLVKVNTKAGGVHAQAPQGKWMSFMTQMQKAAESEQQRRETAGSATNGKPKISSNGSTSTGAPAKHKPKKRK